MSQYLESGIYHTSTDVAEILGLSRARVNILIKERKIECIQLGRHWIFNDEAVREYQHRRLTRFLKESQEFESKLVAKAVQS